MFRFPRPSLQQTVPSATASVLLRCLTVCVFLCLAAAAGFYLLTAFTEDISTHRREMNAAAYKAQIYFDQREALLRYLGDSVLAGRPDAPAADSEGMRQVALDGPGGQPGQRLLLSARAEHTLQALQTHLLLVDARGAHWLAGDAVDVDLARLPSLRALQARNGSLEGADPVYWLRPGERGVALAKPVQAGPQPAQWLVLLLDADAAAGMIDGQGIGGYALLDRAGQPALSSQAPRLDRAGWTTLQQRQNDSFGTLWSGGLPRGVALVKGVGTDGWRLVYHLPPPLLLGDLAAPLLVCLLLLLLAGVALYLLQHRVDRQLIQPALQQHRRLLENLDFSSTVIDMAPVGICVLRRDDRALLLSNQLLRDWLGEEGEHSDWQAPWRGHAGERGRGLEFTTRDGRQLQVLHAACRYQGDDVLLCVFHDISRHRQAQAALSSARQAADAANQAKSAFLATMSHEIRTPLYGVLGTLELLGHTELDARQSQYLRTIESSSSVLLQLISDVLDVSKIESGQLSLEPAAFSPRELTESVLRSFAASATCKGLQVLVYTDPRLPTRVLGDADRIRQVLANLLSNAIKFTEHGRVVLRVRQVQREGDSSVLAWQVTDTGVGIPAEEQARLFEPFRQVRGAASAQGTGLGLSISDRLVRLMSGELQVVSEPGLGSSFSVRLPLPVLAAAEDGPALLPDPPILVRGRNRELVDSACGWLRRWGANAQPLQGDPALLDHDGAILLDGEAGMPLAWTGPRVVASIEGGDQPIVAADGSLVVTLHGMAAIGNALASVQRQRAAQPEPARLAPPMPLGLRVLAVEDNPINRVILAEQLRTLGCEVELAQDGVEALQRCRDQCFDLVVTDINMPRMDGHALARQLRDDGSLVPVIGATANATAEERERCLASGMQGYLSKPIDIARLRKALTALRQGDPA
ncbi:response regulator [Stenotrophomonas maltophilia]|uniref:histidine kinase n=1 Tax=Stenotrophomonas pavanii TaxID=487698 RepID=A0ABN6GPG1_9GAMM|nr:response regulator [Stenotrophomonas pavanii]MBH1390593.1 response regulator [Stenotrophomonas maltophilia]UGB15987.1 response regulator [Stenotrophomonas maltophilia]UGB50865.1 response regulator [Stenotrophomonas maltophilia]BCX42638.1 response regulator [Stenotrophomonas pavanii]